MDKIGFGGEIILKEISCCFTGHREIFKKDEDDIKQKLTDTIEKMIDEGVVRFYCGGAVGFDTLAASCILSLKKKHRHIRLVMALPCTDQDKKFSKSQKQLYRYILDNADEVIYTHDSTHIAGCMHARNRYMVDNCAYCICYIRKESGGTKYTLDYAKKCGLEIVCI